MDGRGRVLIIAGSDSGGGAGIQADIKTVTALGGFAMTAITALTAQDTTGVHGVLAVPPDFVRRQMDVVLDDLGADCIKTGMMADAGVIAAVAAGLDRAGAPARVVVDPVMVATSGAALLEVGAARALREQLIPRASLLTPNLPEAEALLGRKVAGVDALVDAATRLLALGPAAVLLKGGHLDGPDVVDVLLEQGGEPVVFSDPRLHTTSTHGTGCTLASAVACGLAQGLGLVAAVTRARAYVRRAIETAPGLGRGFGPLNHAHPLIPGA